MRRVLRSEEDTQAGNYRPIRVDTPCPLATRQLPSDVRLPALCRRRAGAIGIRRMQMPRSQIVFASGGRSAACCDVSGHGHRPVNIGCRNSITRRCLILRSEDATASPQSPALAIINRRSRVCQPSAGRGCNEANLLVSAHRYFLCPSWSNRSSLARRSGPEGRSCRKARRRRQQPRKAISSSSILHSTN
jgi:hypothetical protein